MNKDNENILELIANEEVEWTKLGEVCEIYSGGDAPKENFSRAKTLEYSIPVISNGIGANAIYGYTNKATIDRPAVTISARGTIGYAEYRDYPYYPIVRLLSLISKDILKLDTKYLYYQMCIVKYNLPITGIPQLTIPKISKIKIPIPSLKLQKKIVDILDKLTLLQSELQTELQAELQYRTKQYIYYREHLLSIMHLNKLAMENLLNGEYELKEYKLEEVCKIKRGRVISKKYLEENKGEYPVYSSQTLNNGEIGKIDTYDLEGEYLTWTTDGAYAGTVFYRNGKFSVTNVCGILKNNDDEKVNIKYLYYYLQNETKKHVKEGSGNPKLMSNEMARIKVLIPPIIIQNIIVEILDKLKKLSDEAQGLLQKEIKQREKQYEYYLEKLLTFDSQYVKASKQASNNT